MYRPPASSNIYPTVHRLRRDTLMRALVEYRQALEMLSIRTPPGAEPLRAYMAEAVHAIEDELHSRGETDTSDAVLVIDPVRD